MLTSVGRGVGRGGGGSGGSGCVSIGGAARSQCTHPHSMSVHLLRCIAWSTTATDAAHSETNMPNSVGVHSVAIVSFVCIHMKK